MNVSPRFNLFASHRSILLIIGVFIIAAAAVAVPVYSMRYSAAQNETAHANKVSATARELGRFDLRLATQPISASKLNSLLPVPQSSPETIETYAQDCTTPKSTFVLGETVCAKTDLVPSPTTDWWVNWILLPSTVVNGGDHVNPVTTNPQTFSYTPTAAGSYKVSLSNVEGDPSQTPASFTVVTSSAPLATYSSDCTTLKSSFNLGQTVCVKVNGLSNDEFPYRRVQLSSPDGFIMGRFDITDNSVQLSYPIPSASTETIDGQLIDHRGTWTVSIIDLDSNLRSAVTMSVHKTNLLADRVADLQVSKSLIPIPDPPDARNLTFDLVLFNGGPDPATNVHLSDVTLSNTSFVSFTRVAAPVALNSLGYSTFGSFLGDHSLSNSNFMRFIRESGPSTYPMFSNMATFMQDSPLEFNCVTPSVGSSGTTTCTTTGELAVGETATFTAVYRVNDNVPSGTVVRDENSATVGSDTADQFTASNTQPATIVTANPNPPTCAFTCPDNITVGTNTINGQGNPGAIVTFGPEAAGNCGTGITSTPASGTFFAVGSTPVNSMTGSGATCSFVVTVVNTPQPTITCAADQSAAAPSGQSEVAVAVPTPAYTGSFVANQQPPALTSSRSDQRDVTDPYPIGTTIITWTVTDQYGTVRSCTQRVVVTSADAPTISCPSDKTFTASAGCETTLTAAQIGSPTVGGAASSPGEPCPVSNPCALRSDRVGLNDPFPAGQTTITWTATNNVGSVSCTQVITVTTSGDTTPPTLTIPADINLGSSECAVLLDDELGVATADDTCTSSVNISRTGLPQIPCPIPGNPGRTCDSFYFPTGTTNITYTATDAAGNSATAVQHVTITESPAIPPTITAPLDLVINTGPTATSCGKFIGDATLGSATAADNCPGVVVTRTGVPAGNNFPVGDTYITYTATDRSGNINTTPAVQKVTVVDNTPPAFTFVPPTVTAYTGPNATTCDTVVSNEIIGTATATDNCGTVTVTRSPSGNTFPVGNTTITWTATDGANPANTTTATQTVTVIDNTVPVITVNGSMPSMWPPNHKYQTFQLTSFVTGASDNCGGIGISDVVIEKVTSDETENGNGDGNTSNDIVIAANCKSVQLRSERDGGGNGRVYTITFKVTDTHGNVGRTTSKVVVQHNPGETAIDSGVHYTVNSSCP